MTYIHNVPGRVRIKSDVLKKNPDAIDAIRNALSTLRGIGTVDINLTTGIIFINYNPKVTNSEEIVVLLKRGGFFDSSRAITNDEYFREGSFFVDIANESSSNSNKKVLHGNPWRRSVIKKCLWNRGGTHELSIF